MQDSPPPVPLPDFGESSRHGFQDLEPSRKNPSPLAPHLIHPPRRNAVLRDSSAEEDEDEKLVQIEAQPPSATLSEQPKRGKPAKDPWPKRIERFALMLSLGISSRERIEEITHPTAHEEWKKFKENIFTRVTNINVVSSLILAVAAAFLTTNPTTSLVNWLHPMPYITLLASFCLGFCSIGSGVFLLLTLMDLRPESLKKISLERGKFGLGLILLALPTLFLGASGATGIVALCGAVWFGDSTIAKVGLIGTCGVTAIIIAGFFLTVY